MVYDDTPAANRRLGIFRGEARASMHSPIHLASKRSTHISMHVFSYFWAFLPSSLTIILTAWKSPGGLGDTRYKGIGNGIWGPFFFLPFLFFSHWEFASTSGKLSCWGVYYTFFGDV